MKKIAIDCRMYGNSGIGTYIREILEYLIKEDKQYLLIGNIEKLKHFKSEKVKILECNIPPFSIKEFIFFPVKEINKYDLFYTPNYNIPGGIKIPIYSTIHDVVFLDIPELVKSKFGRFIRKYFLKRAINISQKIFTVSNFSKQRIENYFGNKKEIIVTYNGISKFILTNEKIEKKRKVKEDYLIFVGNIKKHKGLKVLLGAYQKALKLGLNKKLIIVGNSFNFKTKDDELFDYLNNKKNKDIVFTGFISNEELLNYIYFADVLVQPSLYEGFGIPPLEALFLNTPVIISDIVVFKEIYNYLPVTFFKTGNEEDLNKKLFEIKKIKDIENLRKEILSIYSYDCVAKNIINNI